MVLIFNDGDKRIATSAWTVERKAQGITITFFWEDSFDGCACRCFTLRDISWSQFEDVLGKAHAGVIDLRGLA